MSAENREAFIRFPDYIREIISRFCEEGYDAYAVGGCIRDSILGRIPNDWDVTTSADPHETVRIFGDKVIGTAGIRHGTVMVKIGGAVCEITTFRSDGDYRDHRRPDNVSFSDSIEEDLVRRDFTMNAVAAKPLGEGTVIVDPFGGIADIEDRIIRTVGDPEKRFEEDALRILRGVRFTSELGFSTDRATAEAANRLCGTLGFVSAERITAELWRTLSGEYLTSAVNGFGEVFRWLGASNRFYTEFPKTNDPYVRLAMMAEHGSDGRELFVRFRFPAKTVNLVKRLLSIENVTCDTVAACGLMRDFGDGITSALEYVRVTESANYDRLIDSVVRVTEYGIPYTTAMLNVSGQDAVAAGLAGAEIKTALEHLLREVQLGNIPNEKASLLGEFRKIKYQRQ